MDDFQKYLDKALHFLSYRARSEKELRDKLVLKNAPADIIERVIASLKEHKFLNDVEFAKQFIEQRLRFRPKSLRIIKMELKQKGVDPEIIDEAFVNLQNSTEDLSGSDLESAKKLVERKIDKYKDLSRQEIYQKLGGFLARRGFDWDTIKKSIDDSLEHKV
jgi:regulatory protein